MMKRKEKFLKVSSFAFFSILLLGLNATGQVNKTVVYYDCVMNLKAAFAGDDGLKIVSGSNDTTISNFSIPDSIDIVQTISKFKVAGDSKSATIYKPFYVSNGWRNFEKNSFDSVQYLSSSWRLFKNGKSHDLLSNNIQFIETSEQKIILGYICKKIIAVQSDKNTTYELWVTAELPKTLMPVRDLSPTFGAVLLCTVPASGISV